MWVKIKSLFYLEMKFMKSVVICDSVSPRIAKAPKLPFGRLPNLGPQQLVNIWRTRSVGRTEFSDPRD